MPSMWSGNQRRWSIADHPIPSPACAAGARSPTRRGDDQDVREDVDPRRLPRLARRPSSCRSPPCSSPAVRSPRRTSGRSASAGRDRRRGAARRRRADRDALGRAYDRSSDIATAVTEVLTEAGHAPDPAGEPTARRGPRDVRSRSRPPPAPARQGGAARGAPRPVVDPRTAARSSRCCAASSGSGSARGSSRRRSPRRSTGRWTTSSGPGMLTGDIGRTAVLARRGPARRAPR